MWFCHRELPLIYVSQTQRITVEVFKQERLNIWFGISVLRSSAQFNRTGRRIKTKWSHWWKNTQSSFYWLHLSVCFEDEGFRRLETATEMQPLMLIYWGCRCERIRLHFLLPDKQEHRRAFSLTSHRTLLQYEPGHPSPFCLVPLVNSFALLPLNEFLLLSKWIDHHVFGTYLRLQQVSSLPLFFSPPTLTPNQTLGHLRLSTWRPEIEAGKRHWRARWACRLTLGHPGMGLAEDHPSSSWLLGQFMTPTGGYCTADTLANKWLSHRPAARHGNLLPFKGLLIIVCYGTSYLTLLVWLPCLADRIVLLCLLLLKCLVDYPEL